MTRAKPTHEERARSWLTAYWKLATLEDTTDEKVVASLAAQFAAVEASVVAVCNATPHAQQLGEHQAVIAEQANHIATLEATLEKADDLCGEWDGFGTIFSETRDAYQDARAKLEKP